MRLGYKYYWQYKDVPVVAETLCQICGATKAHTLEHYVMDCPSLCRFRNTAIDYMTENIIWMSQNGKIT